MIEPIPLNFDYQAGQSYFDGVAHLPKIRQNANYKASVDILDGTNTPRNLNAYTLNAILKFRTGETIVLTESQIYPSITGFTLDFDGSLTVPIQSDSSHFGISEVPFIHQIVLLENGKVVEHFAQGTGLLVLMLDPANTENGG